MGKPVSRRTIVTASILIGLTSAIAAHAQPSPAPAAPPAQAADSLNLMCSGEGTANKVDVTTATTDSDYSVNHGKGSVSGSSQTTVQGTHSEGFADQVNLQLSGTEGRLRMPRAMLPPIRGGENGWFRLKDVRISDGEITATVAVNPLNNPKLRLDRYSGAISISGKAGNYAGNCQKYDPATTQRKF